MNNVVDLQAYRNKKLGITRHDAGGKPLTPGMIEAARVRESQRAVHPTEGETVKRAPDSQGVDIGFEKEQQAVRDNEKRLRRERLAANKAVLRSYRIKGDH